jgi:FtsP/CotA-like multicopper oxidase with cupredoxin domain
VLHDSSFSPDFILRVTEQPYNQSCISKSEVILINGTFPGPEIRLKEGDIYWIRVFNDMKDKNLTMVSEIKWHESGLLK